MNQHTSPREAINSLYELYADDVYRYVLSVLKEVDVVPDVVQEVFLRAYRSWSEYRGDSAPKAWLLTIARNCIFDLYRRRRTRKRNLHVELQTNGTYTTYTSVETKSDVENALGQLKVVYRHV